MKKTNSIYFWKIIFTYMVIIYHFDNVFLLFGDMGIARDQSIPVEFFFVVSGFLIARRAEQSQQTYKTATAFTIHRYRNLWPKYVVALGLTFLVTCYVTRPGWIQAGKQLLDSYWEIFLLQGIGLDRGWDYINPPLWYISIMLIAGHFLYYLLLHHKRALEQVIAPAIVIVCYSYLYRHVGSISTVVDMDDFYINYALMRGFADMCLGLFSAKLYQYIMADPSKVKQVKWISPLIFISIILLSLKVGSSRLDFLFVLLFVPAVAIAFVPYEQKEMLANFIEKWSGITYSIYLLHDIFRAWLFPKVFFTGTYALAEKFKIMGGYVIAVTVAAIVFDGMFVIAGRRKKDESTRSRKI